ncbi:hypothetical protein N7467_001716 [Penicillium canescens]|nr:hypothetical protein N7467_001716 [Penicillium canescens]
MPRYHNSPSETDSYEFDYSTVETNISRDEINDCKFPAFPARTKNKVVRHATTGAIWFGLVVLASLIGIAVVVIVLFAVKTDNNGFDQNSSEYALYKNSMFKDCYNVPPPVVNNCTAIESILRLGQDDIVAQNFGYISKLNIFDSTNSETRKSSYDWCEVVSCFNEFKIVPSSPRPSAFWATTIAAYTKAAMIFLFALWQLRKLQKALYSSRRDPCKKIEWDVWAIMAWDVVSAVWWWIDFGRHLNNPTEFPAPGMLSWVSLWKYGYLISFHPYNCAIEHAPTTAWVTKWTLYTLAVVQWVASVYIWKASADTVSKYPTYECLASQISAAPGTSTCSVDQICSRELLFHAYHFAFSNEVMDVKDPNLGVFVVFIFLTLGFFYRVYMLNFFALLESGFHMERFKKAKQEMYKYDFGYAGSIGLSAFISIIFGALTAAGAIMAFQNGREAAVAVDWACQTVHVTLSPWRYYFDVQYQLPLRAVKMWFNV